MINYENVFLSKYTLYERLFNSETREVTIKKADYKPEIFTKTKNQRESEWKYFLDDSIQLEKHVFDSESEYKDFIKFQEQIGGVTYGQMTAPYSHIRQNFYKTKTDFTSRIWYFDIETRVLPGQGFPHADETPSAINMFQIYDNLLDKIIILADENISKEKLDYLMKKHPNLVFKSFPDEMSLFNAFIKMIQSLKPCIITAWNGNKFDFPYITNRAKMLGIYEGNLSLVNHATSTKNINKVTNEVEYVTKWDGIYLLDMMELYKKFTYTTQTSYSLENICKVELGEGEGKVDYGEFKNISDFMHGDWEKFVEYGIMDVVLLNKIDSKLNLIELTRMIAYKMGINVDDALGTVKPWATYLSNIAYDRGLILPNKNESDYTGIAGGWVANPKKCKHTWIVSFDFASLYPSTMRWNNMSPEMILREDEITPELRALREKIYYLVEAGEGIENDPLSTNERFTNLFINSPDVLRKASKILEKHNVSCGVNGAYFKKDKQGVIPELIKSIYTDRKKAKKKMFEHEQYLQKPGISEDEVIERKRLVSFYDTEQMTLKILMNSLYGACANKHFVLFNQSLAEAITANGRMINQFCTSKLENYLKELTGKSSVIYGDTDSCYITLANVIPKDLLEENDKQKITDWCDTFCSTELQKVIDEALEEVSNLVNAYEPDAQAEDREIIADSGFWVAKKKYSARVIDSEGVRLKIPKLKVMGLEIVRSNTPTYCRKTLKESVEIILDKDENEVQDYIKGVKEEFFSQDIELISRVTGVSNLNYELNTSKSIPINSRAAIVHNLMIDQLNLSKSHEYITSSDKIKYVFLKVPNPAFNQNVIGYKDPKILTDAGLDKYIDKDEMFDKFFLSPMNIMLTPMGWNAYKQNDFSEWDF
jgi:DNA polymerase elongation subunit (family B)